MMVYVIMKKADSPIAITEAKPHKVVKKLAAARRLVVILNDKARNNQYWISRVELL